ncbi:MAG: hypothetical protein H7Z17_09650, partial [Fuerstia sp.]|nr:hypothetical protein [Fuerstiella sp.]
IQAADQLIRQSAKATDELVLRPPPTVSTADLHAAARRVVRSTESPVGDPPDPQKSPWEAIVAAKELLANSISDHVANVFEVSDPNDGLEDAREMLRQQLLVNLTAAFTVDVIVQYPVDVTHSEYPGDDLLAPQLFGKPVTESPDDPAEVARKDAFSFSTARFSLAKRAVGTHLTFSFDTNREQQGKNGKQLDDIFTIELFHQINALEHEIHPVKGIDGYLASSWLSFVLPDNFDTPGERKILVPLGEQTIPVPLRAYPTPPSLSEQTFVPRVKQFVGGSEQSVSAEDDKLQQARLWNYRCRYDYVGAAHDKILASIRLNVPPNKALQARFADEENPDLFAALVQFAAAYPAIARDLDQYLVKETDSAIAFNAISSFAWLAQRTANAWQSWQEDRTLHAAAKSESPEYHFVTAQRSEVISDVVALVVSVTGDGSRFQLPEVEIAGYTTAPYSQAGDSVSYYFISEQNAQPLTFEVGRNFSARQLVFKDFDILKVENAWAGAAVKRNEDLLPDQITNPDFIFQSPVVRFVNVLTPLLDPEVEINIAAYTPEPPAVLSVFLSNFLIAFFEAAQMIGNENRTIRLAAAYSYGLHDSAQLDATSAELPDLDITIPILLTTPTSVSISPGGLSPGSAFVQAVSKTINDWIKTRIIRNEPNSLPDSGRLWFDLSVYSSLSDSQLPVLRMRRLFLETKWVVFEA